MSEFRVAVHAFVEKNGYFLFLRRSANNDYEPLKWDIPGGEIEFGESIEHALMREVDEETTISVDMVKSLHIFSNMAQIPTRETIQITYYCKYIKGEIQLNPKEHDMYKWLDIKSAQSLQLMDFVHSLLQDITSRCLEMNI